MTRVNVIDVADLTDSWLLAEFVEIIRLPKTYLKSKVAKNPTKAPKEYTLGRGHVVFFHDKGEWLSNRYNEIYQEWIDRGFKATKLDIPFNIIPSVVYEAKATDYIKNIERFKEKFEQGQQHKLRKKPVDPKKYIDFLMDKYYINNINNKGGNNASLHV
jgi:deoxyribonuclease (pyrimidine dimer)